MTPESALEEELLRQREKVDRAQNLVTPLLEIARFDASNEDMGLMAFSFVHKQMEHIKSVCILIDNQQYRDAWGISRIMFEGLVLLLWSSRDYTRAYNWRSYMWVGEFKQWYGKPEYLLKQKEIELNLKTHCTQFLRKKSKNKPQDQIIPDDYFKQWYIGIRDEGKSPVPLNTEEMIDEIKLKLLYHPAYNLVSGWFHWDSYIFDQILKSEVDCANYAETKWLGLIAYESGYRSLLACAAIFDDLLGLHSPALRAELES